MASSLNGTKNKLSSDSEHLLPLLSASTSQIGKRSDLSSSLEDNPSSRRSLTMFSSLDQANIPGLADFSSSACRFPPHILVAGPTSRCPPQVFQADVTCLADSSSSACRFQPNILAAGPTSKRLPQVLQVLVSALQCITNPTHVPSHKSSHVAWFESPSFSSHSMNNTPIAFPLRLRSSLPHHLHTTTLLLWISHSQPQTALPQP